MTGWLGLCSPQIQLSRSSIAWLSTRVCLFLGVAGGAATQGPGSFLSWASQQDKPRFWCGQVRRQRAEGAGAAHVARRRHPAIPLRRLRAAAPAAGSPGPAERARACHAEQQEGHGLESARCAAVRSCSGRPKTLPLRNSRRPKASPCTTRHSRRRADQAMLGEGPAQQQIAGAFGRGRRSRGVSLGAASFTSPCVVPARGMPHAGGKRKLSDIDARGTALREMMEETGGESAPPPPNNNSDIPCSIRMLQVCDHRGAPKRGAYERLLNRVPMPYSACHVIARGAALERGLKFAFWQDHQTPSPRSRLRLPPSCFLQEQTCVLCVCSH
jgi:hypothetical protein